MQKVLVNTEKPSTFYIVYLEREVIENGSQFDKKTGNQKLYDTEI
jgi:hypothetical protein